ncbi:MAG: trypsin-like peptidase domain-containing protein [Planctomycetales bacterium]|nr:trypsin-like peptidase domain-containing protein [Planctomycetales bacterium]
MQQSKRGIAIPTLLFCATNLVLLGGCQQNSDAQPLKQTAQQTKPVTGSLNPQSQEPQPAVPMMRPSAGKVQSSDPMAGANTSGMAPASAATPMIIAGVEQEASKELLRLYWEHQKKIAQISDASELQKAFQDVHVAIDKLYELHTDNTDFPATTAYIVEQKIRFFVDAIERKIPDARQQLDEYVASLEKNAPDSEEAAEAVGLRLYHLEIVPGGPGPQKEELIAKYLETWGEKRYSGRLVYMYGALLANSQGDEARLNWLNKNSDKISGPQASSIRREMTRSKLIGSSPTLSGAMINGNSFDLASLRGKVVLVDFWATWCGPCVKNLPEVKKVYEEYQDQGFEVVGFSMDRTREPLEEFLGQNEYDWIQVYIPDEDKRTKIADRFGVVGIPATYLIDQQGKIVAVNLRSHDDIASAVGRLLGKAAEAGSAEVSLPLDPFGKPIDNAMISRHFEVAGRNLLLQEEEVSVEQFQKMLKDAPRTISVDADEFSCMRPNDRSEMYRHIVKSTVLLGELYDCGQCDKTHAKYAGGVLISSDGLMLTNYHVLESKDTSKTKGFYAMTWEGKMWSIESVLLADRSQDLALLKLKSNGEEFHAAPLADEAPKPIEQVRVISHPSQEFFVMTHGEVSRYVIASRDRSRSDEDQNEVGYWMEITAPYGVGSSGSGIFNAQGEIVGLVSRLKPLMHGEAPSPVDARNSSLVFVEMYLRRCIPLKSIRSRFLQEPSKRASN